MDEVKKEEVKNKTVKSKPLYKMFNSIPEKYDLMNRVFTLRFDESWRKKASRECLKDNPERILDLCTGTGDMIIRMAKETKNGQDLKALDFSENMLEYARMKAGRSRLENKIDFIHADASDMPFENDYFDRITIAFAFRNLTYKNPISDAALKEVVRVTKPGGKFIIVESSRPDNILIKPFFKLYINIMVKWLGGKISGHKSAYNYLAYSAKNYYTADEVCELLIKAGFKKARYKKFIGGIAAMHIATK